MHNTRKADFTIFTEESLAVVREIAARVKLSKNQSESEDLDRNEAGKTVEHEREPIFTQKTVAKTENEGMLLMFLRACCCYCRERRERSEHKTESRHFSPKHH